MEDILVPIFVCVVLPVSIVLISALAKMNADNKRSQTLIKAIESHGNDNVDMARLIEALNPPSGKKQKSSSRELLYRHLLSGCIFSLCGLVMVAVGIINLATGAHFSSDQVTVTLLLGGISLAVGISFLIVYAVRHKDLADSVRTLETDKDLV